jgi:hypothetical protein
MTRMTGLRPLLFAAAAIGNAGCYAYVAPPPRADSLVGRAVQATLTDSGAVVLAPRIGPAVEQVRGRIVRESAGVVTLAMDETVQRDGLGTTWKQEQVDVPRPLVRLFEVRAFSPSRTALFGAITSLALFAAERGFLHGGGSNAPGTGQTGTPVGK